MENIGKRFGDRVIIGVAEPLVATHQNRRITAKRYMCRCKCGLESVVILSALVHGKQLSCGSCGKDRSDKLVIGSKINSWTIKKKLGVKYAFGVTAYYYLCECACGELAEKTKYALESYGVELCRKCFIKKVNKLLPKQHVSSVNVGDVFGLWTVVDYCIRKDGRISNGKSLCVCECGTFKEIHHCLLKKSRTTRCRKCFLELVRRKTIKLDSLCVES